jgi:hypothetical protein
MVKMLAIGQQDATLGKYLWSNASKYLLGLIDRGQEWTIVGNDGQL